MIWHHTGYRNGIKTNLKKKCLENKNRNNLKTENNEND